MYSIIIIAMVHFAPEDTLRPPGDNLIKVVGEWLIEIYQNTLSRIQGDVCNFTPSCSHYTEESIKRYGFLKGVIMGADRLLRCHGGAWKYRDIYYKVKMVKYRGWKLEDRPEDNYIW